MADTEIDLGLVVNGGGGGGDEDSRSVSVDSARVSQLLVEALLPRQNWVKIDRRLQGVGSLCVFLCEEAFTTGGTKIFVAGAEIFSSGELAFSLSFSLIGMTCDVNCLGRFMVVTVVFSNVNVCILVPSFAASRLLCRKPTLIVDLRFDGSVRK